MIYYVPIATDAFYMMMAYAKNQQEDLSTEQRRGILDVLESIKKVRG